MKSSKLVNTIAKLNTEEHEELIDEIICKAINNGVDIDKVEEEEQEEVEKMLALCY